ncbi:MAG: ABC transporter permease [Methanobrevibacter sp.]|jgi:ABC-2 type transport system permease protein|nr:ABC transporter permease [Candidatus Methanovirga aequatorialis]
MSELEGIYQIWLREAKRTVRYKSRVITSIITPLIWILVFGVGLGSTLKIGMTGGYQAFIYPGIIAQAILFTTVLGGVGILMDKQYGILKEIMVAPLSRPSIILGKALGISTTAIMQAGILLLLSFIINVPMDVVTFILSICLCMLIAIGFSSVGLLIASFMESTEGFNLIMTFVVMPIFFLSGALFPVTGLPEWLNFIVYLDPLTYGVDALRGVLLHSSTLPMHLNLIVLTLFAIITISLSAIAFTKKEQNLI